MRLYTSFTLLILTALLFSACGGKVFTPEDVVDDRDLSDSYEAEMFMQHREGVTYDTGVFLTKKGLFTNFKLPKGFAYLNESNNTVISADNTGKVLVQDKTGQAKQTLDLSDRVLSAAVSGDMLAVVTVKNQMKLFSLTSQKETFTFSGSAVTAIDVRLAPPKFYEGLIFFPSLDGKIQIYSKTAKKMIRTMSVSTKEQFNNIIFFEVVDKKLLAATGSKVYVFSKKSAQKKIPVREIFLSGEDIVVLRKDGRVVLMNLDLDVRKELKYPFARFLGGMSTNEAIYVDEKEGYLIKIKKDFSLSLVYELDFDSEIFFAGEKSFYFSDGYFTP
jgi:WD40 repeat protein